jgi:hypothetical protein
MIAVGFLYLICTTPCFYCNLLEYYNFSVFNFICYHFCSYAKSVTLIMDQEGVEKCIIN